MLGNPNARGHVHLRLPFNHFGANLQAHSSNVMSVKGTFAHNGQGLGPACKRCASLASDTALSKGADLPSCMSDVLGHDT